MKNEDAVVTLQVQLMSIEKGLWTNDPQLYGSTLTSDALLVFAETGPISRDVAVAAIEKENAEGRRWADVEFEGFRVSQPTDGVALVHYRVIARWAHESTPLTALATSLYVSRGEEWKLAFHQQTTVDN